MMRVSSCCSESVVVFMEKDLTLGPCEQGWSMRDGSKYYNVRFCPSCGSKLREGITTEEALRYVAQERSRQDTLWGQQNHTDGTGFGFYADLGEELENTGRARQEDIPMSWADILIEEVGEALRESDTRKLRDELVQVAAVAVSWVEAITRAEE